MLEYFLNSVSYSIVGFIAGWLVAREAQNRKIDREEAMPSTGIKAPRKESSKSKSQRGLGYLILVLAVFTVLQSFYFSSQQNKATECLSRYNTNVAQTQDIRAELADSDRRALVSFIDTLGNPSATKDERTESFENLQKTYAENSVKREKAVYPELKACE